jgi:hypothetical protein
MYKKYQLVYLSFWDHSEAPANEPGAVKCEVFGVLKNEDDLCYYVCPWICDYDLGDSNTDMYCILKSTVLDYKRLKVI